MLQKRTALVAILLVATLVLAGCSEGELMDQHTGLIVQWSGTDGVTGAEVVTSGLVEGKPFVVLKVIHNSAEDIYDVRLLKSKTTTETGNWLNPGDSVTVKMFEGDQLKVINGTEVIMSYVVVKGHYIPADQKLSVVRAKTGEPEEEE